MNVQLLEVFGDDLTVVNAARVSFSKAKTELDAGDGKLIGYLADHEHISPFFHPQLRFRIRLPIFLAREWFRHQIGFARNEESRRYIDSTPELFQPTLLRARHEKKKQGSSDTVVSTNAALIAYMQRHGEESIALYEKLLEQNVCPEQARMVLPQSMMTEFIETGSLAAYARLCNLRTAPDAQKEIRDAAALVADQCRTAFPISWAALTKE